MIAVQGPNARAKVWQALPGSEAPTQRCAFNAVLRHAGTATLFIARTGYTGEDGFEIVRAGATRAAALWHALAARRRCARAGSARATRCASKRA